MREGVFVLTSKLFAAWLACTLSLVPAYLAAEQPQTMLQTVLGTDSRLAQRMVIYRSNPEVLGRVSTITENNIASSYSAKLDITHEESNVIRAILSEMQATSMTSGCGESDRPPKTLPIAWAMAFYNISDKEMGAVYLLNDGKCVIFRDRLYSIDPSFISMLQKALSPIWR